MTFLFRQRLLKSCASTFDGTLVEVVFFFESGEMLAAFHAGPGAGLVVARFVAVLASGEAVGLVGGPVLVVIVIFVIVVVMTLAFMLMHIGELFVISVFLEVFLISLTSG